MERRRGGVGKEEEGDGKEEKTEKGMGERRKELEGRREGRKACKRKGLIMMALCRESPAN